MEESVKIPKARIAVLIGEKGATKKQIEKAARIKMDIDSKSGEVHIKGTQKNPLQYYISTNIIKAIGRGFSPEHALLLLDENIFLDLLDIEDYSGGNKKEAQNKKGRVIGRHGEARKRIEQATDCFISVYGHTIGIIGKPEDLEAARKAIEMLLQGVSHERMYSYIKRRESGKGLEEIGL